MASLIEGYNYDIFISYRQKDNKGDKWVSEFVEALKTELESTFKEEVSVYFDINPYDGLLETHDVDESLKEKLQCLIFIPIISRTYCDPKSFAWEHEFRAFIKEASNDQFGLKVKLPNGNVASRVLPVLIHDLDKEDISQCESVLGSVLRGIEFIYKEAGIDKPLAPDDDEKKNLNNTKYRIQIVKVAHAIKEIMTALKGYEQVHEPLPREVAKPELENVKTNRIKILAGSIFIMAVIVLGIIFIPKFLNPKEELEKSIAVLPFVNLSNDPEQEYFSAGLVDEIFDRLCRIGDLKVISRTSSDRFKDSDLSLKEIGLQLGASAIMEGSVQKSGNRIRIAVQLIDTESDTHMWSKIFNQDFSDIFSIYIQVAEAVAGEMNAVITPEEKQMIEKKPTDNLDAYEAWMKGLFYLQKFTPESLDSAMHYFELAKEIDPDHVFAYTGIYAVWLFRRQAGIVTPAEGTSKADEVFMQMWALDSNNVDLQIELEGQKAMRIHDWETLEAVLKKRLSIHPNDVAPHAQYSHKLLWLGRFEEAQEQMEIAIKLDPMNPFRLVWYGVVLCTSRKYDEAIKAFQDALIIEPNYPFAQGNLGTALYLIGEHKEALDQWKLSSGNDTALINAYDNGFAEGGFKGAHLASAKLCETRFKNSYWSPTGIAVEFLMAGENDKALYWLDQAYKMNEPNLPYVFLNPLYDPIRDDPRFQEIARKMNLPYK
jgi:adenylate cyclase